MKRRKRQSVTLGGPWVLFSIGRAAIVCGRDRHELGAAVRAGTVRSILVGRQRRIPIGTIAKMLHTTVPHARTIAEDRIRDWESRVGETGPRRILNGRRRR